VVPCQSGAPRARTHDQLAESIRPTRGRKPEEKVRKIEGIAEEFLRQACARGARVAKVRYFAKPPCCASEQGVWSARWAKNAGKKSTATEGIWRMSFLIGMGRAPCQPPRHATR
jgi:hypothetical protein